MRSVNVTTHVATRRLEKTRKLSWTYKSRDVGGMSLVQAVLTVAWLGDFATWFGDLAPDAAAARESAAHAFVDDPQTKQRLNELGLPKKQDRRAGFLYEKASARAANKRCSPC